MKRHCRSEHRVLLVGSRPQVQQYFQALDCVGIVLKVSSFVSLAQVCVTAECYKFQMTQFSIETCRGK